MPVRFFFLPAESNMEGLVDDGDMGGSSCCRDNAVSLYSVSTRVLSSSTHDCIYAFYVYNYAFCCWRLAF